jgi:hypothetical protein
MFDSQHFFCKNNQVVSSNKINALKAYPDKKIDSNLNRKGK